MNTKEAAALGFDHLLGHYRPMILSTAKVSYIPNMAFEDIEQELNLVLWRCHERARIGQVRNEGFDGFLRRCMRNRLIDMTLGSARRPPETFLEKAEDTPGTHSCKALQDVEAMAHLESVPMSKDANLLMRIVLADAKDFREAFMRRAGGARRRTRYDRAKSELRAVLAPYRQGGG